MGICRTYKKYINFMFISHKCVFCIYDVTYANAHHIVKMSNYILSVCALIVAF